MKAASSKKSSIFLCHQCSQRYFFSSFVRFNGLWKMNRTEIWLSKSAESRTKPRFRKLALIHHPYRQSTHKQHIIFFSSTLSSHDMCSHANSSPRLPIYLFRFIRLVERLCWNYRINLVGIFLVSYTFSEGFSTMISIKEFHKQWLLKSILRRQDRNLLWFIRSKPAILSLRNQFTAICFSFSPFPLSLSFRRWVTDMIGAYFFLF